jgi:hypothetical protein
MSRPPSQLTIRGFDAALERRIRETARREGISLNRAALRLLRRGAGLEVPAEDGDQTVGSSLDDLIGTWTDDEAREFADAIADLEAVDEEMWR